MLNQLSKEIHEGNKKKGFYDDFETIKEAVNNTLGDGFAQKIEDVFDAQRLALIHSEASEALESTRKHRIAELTKPEKELMSDMQGAEFKKYYDEVVKGSLEEEVADIIIRCFDFVGFKKIDIDFHVEQKLKYNALRPYKHGKKY